MIIWMESPEGAPAYCPIIRCEVCHKRILRPRANRPNVVVWDATSKFPEQVAMHWLCWQSWEGKNKKKLHWEDMAVWLEALTHNTLWARSPNEDDLGTVR